MHGALPDPDTTQNFAVPLVTAESPPILLTYGPECPKPIKQDCVTSPEPGDIHNPKNGQKIMDKYNEVGLGSQANLIDGMDNAGILNVLFYFPSFASALATNAPIKDISTTILTVGAARSSQAFPLLPLILFLATTIVSSFSCKCE